jgi:hypothetical protein
MGRAGMTLMGAIGNILRKLAAVPLPSSQIPHGMSCLTLYFNGPLAETVPTG